jgi:hypothetical protein
MPYRTNQKSRLSIRVIKHPHWRTMQMPIPLVIYVSERLSLTEK